MRPCIHGRSSSHFTRVARVFARALEVAHDFAPVHDLLSQEVRDYGDNPALKLPVLTTEEGPWFGVLSICRELTRRAPASLRIVWPEQLRDRLAANAQELVLQGMTSEVVLVMSSLAAPGSTTAYDDKTRQSLTRILSWLDAQLPGVLATLDPERQLSFLEVTTYCFVTHLEFRRLVDTSDYENLQAFCRAYGVQPALRDTAYHFDAAPPQPGASQARGTEHLLR